eukprot:15477416-Alexandrium_andersonii.AAC.1
MSIYIHKFRLENVQHAGRNARKQAIGACGRTSNNARRRWRLHASSVTDRRKEVTAVQVLRRLKIKTCMQSCLGLEA